MSGARRWWPTWCPRPRPRPAAEELEAFLADKLARYKIPREFQIVEELPHTPTGKVMKYKLRQEIRRLGG